MSREVTIHVYFEKDGQYINENPIPFGLEDFGTIPALGDVIFSISPSGSFAAGKDAWEVVQRYFNPYRNEKEIWVGLVVRARQCAEREYILKGFDD